MGKGPLAIVKPLRVRGYREDVQVALPLRNGALRELHFGTDDAIGLKAEVADIELGLQSSVFMLYS